MGGALAPRGARPAANGSAGGRWGWAPRGAGAQCAAGRPGGRMSRFLCVLRSWLLMVSVIAAGNTLQCFRDYSFVSEKLYTASPGLGKG